MKWISGSFFRSFQFRLLTYLLIVGSIPLFLSVFVYYQQSVHYARSTLGDNIRYAHELMLGRLKQEMGEMDTLAKQVAADPDIQRLAKAASPNDGTDSLIEDRLVRLIGLHSQSSRYQVCFSGQNVQTAACSMFTDDATSRIFAGEDKAFHLVMLAPDHWEQQAGIVLRVPILDPLTRQIREQIVVAYNVSKLFDDFKQDNRLIAGQFLFDEQDREFPPEGKNSDPLPGQKGMKNADHPAMSSSLAVDELPVTLEGYTLDWVYRIVVQNDFVMTTWQKLKMAFLILLAVLIALSTVSSIVFSRFITKPIHSLRSLMKRAEAGDLRAYWSNHSAKEIDDLGESYNQMLFRLDELFRQVKLEEALKKEAEIEALQYQLNPHFLYNTLNTIKWVAKIHKTPQISEVVSSLVRLLRASLGKKGDFLTVREEVKLIQDYMEIQTFRYGEQVRLQLEIDSVAAVCLVPRMILQPLVENALIHGIEPSQREGIITIKAWIERDLLFCQVEDNGVGMDVDQSEEGAAAVRQGVREKLSGIGMNHIRQKIKLYYGPDYKMHIFSRKNEGTTIRLSLPIHRGEEEWRDESDHRG